MEVVLALVSFAFFVVVVGKASGRILGIRLGNVRGVLVGVVGWIAGIAATAYTVGEATREGGRRIDIGSLEEWLGTGTLIVLFGVLAAMPVAIGVDLLTRGQPVARRRRRWWLHPVRSIQLALAPYRRLQEVIGHARKHELLHLRYASASALGSRDLPRRIRIVLEESGGMLVKLGQIASTRTDVLPDTLTTELARLRSQVRPVAAEDVRATIEAELGAPVEQAFASFDPEPLAAASIGQTHRAVLHDGTHVVVKVRRPRIDEVVARDAAVLRMVARRLERRVDAARAVGLRGLTEELIGGLEEELDFLREARIGTTLAENRAHDVGISVPRVYPALSTERVLAMDEVEGRSVADPDALAASPVPRPELARRLLSSYIGQVLDDGLFHGDPHPGNLFLDAAGTIWMLDFGSVGRLDARALTGLRGIALGVATNEPAVLARAARDLAGDDGAVDLRALESDMAVALGQLDGGGGLDPQAISEILAVLPRHGLQPPASISLLARSLITIEGTLRGIEPDFAFTATSRDIVLTEQRDAIATPEEILQREALRSLPALRTLPEHAETLANQLRSGRLAVRTELFAGESREVADNWIDRIVIAVAGGFGAVAGAIVLAAASATDDEAVRTALWILGFAGLSGGSILLMRSAARALRRTAGRID